MIFIYNCYGGSHSSVTAAALHLGLLPVFRVPRKEELLNLPYYDAQVAKDHGRIRFMGFDDRGNTVYVASRKNMGRDFEKAIVALLHIIGEGRAEVVIIDTMPYVNILMMLGGYISRRLGLSFLGRPLIIFGTQRSFFRFARLSEKIRKQFCLPEAKGENNIS